MTLMPVSKISTVGDRSSKAGGSRWISQRSPSVDRVAVVDRLAQHVEDPAQRLLADRHRDRARRCRSPRCRGPGRRWRPWRSRARGRRPGAAAPRPPAWWCRCPSAAGTAISRALKIAGSSSLERGVDDDALDLDDLADIVAVGSCHVTPFLERVSGVFGARTGILATARPAGAELRDTPRVVLSPAAAGAAGRPTGGRRCA